MENGAGWLLIEFDSSTRSCYENQSLIKFLPAIAIEEMINCLRSCSMFWEREIETMDRRELTRVQLSRLKKTMKQAAKSPAYSKLFKTHRISPEKIRTLDDLRRLPFTTKAELRQQFPYGFVTVDKEKIVPGHSYS